MPSSKMRFSCGHRGFGSFCHRCKDAERLEALSVQSTTVPTKKRKEATSSEKEEQARQEAQRKRYEFEAAALRSVLPREEFRKEWLKQHGGVNTPGTPEPEPPAESQQT